VRVRVGDRDGAERPGPYEESEVRDFDVAPEDFVEDPGREMEAGGRRRDGALRARKDRLLPLAVPGIVRAPDVRRERNVADRGEPCGRQGRIEAHAPLAVGQDLHDRAPQPAGERDLLPGTGAAPGPGKRRPDAVRFLVEQEDFDGTPVPIPEETGRNDAGVVPDEKIARPEERGEVGEGAILDRPGGRFHDEQPRRSAGPRLLRDAVGRKDVIEQVDKHATIIVKSPFDAAAPGSRTNSPAGGFFLRRRRRSALMVESPAFVRKARIMDAERMERAIVRMAHEIAESERDLSELAVIGIRTRGVPLAERLARTLEKNEGIRPATGSLDITLYRDDLSTVGAQPLLRKTDLTFDIKPRVVILCDDVLYTGRTIRAALDGLSDYGRAKAIRLAVLIDRGHRELPIEANYVGKRVPTSSREHIQVLFQETDGADETWIMERG